MTNVIKITVLGGGRWGSAMALYLDSIGFDVTLYFHSKQSLDFALEHKKSKRLLQFQLTSTIKLTDQINQALEQAEYIFISIPVSVLRQFLENHHTCFDQSLQTIIGINKGIEIDTLKTPPEIVEEFLPKIAYAQLGGPCFPEGLINPVNPAAETLAIANRQVGIRLQSLFSSPTFRVYLTDESPSIIAFLGASKNVYAIVAGVISSLGLSEESYAILITRSIAEIKRLFKKMNLSEKSIYGLGGLGDLVLTCYSNQSSQNKLFGCLIGQGLSVENAILEMKGKECEGYYTTQALYQLMQKYETIMPIAHSIYQVLYEKKALKEAMQTLMNRDPKFED